ncbi:MAG: formylglycine-generating enzyme family protein [Kiritimatiellae bacterium]|nr:formylglycine-generating enzyme family protein [Kiritimatiellia bacterium]
MTTTAKMILGSFAACLAVGALAAEVSQVTVRQRWPWSRLVDIDYVLSDVTQSVDIAVSGHNGVNPVELPGHSLSGDLYGVASDGLHRIVWDPTVSGCTNQGVLAKFKVTLTPSIAPLYVIVDLNMNAGADGQIEYIYPGDPRLVTEGRFTNVWFSVTNDVAYASNKLVLRLIPGGAYTMGGQGYAEYAMNLPKAMYAGVFEVTQKQWNLVMGTTGGTDTQAKHSVSYDGIRGATNSTPAVDWPTTGRAVAPDSFIGKLRAKTGITDFDLPTEAQWEYFCRARTTTVFNDGNAGAYYTGSIADNNGNSNQYLNVLGWYKFNNPTPPTIPQPVGGKLPNAWGLYDTHGNVWEWCLDWYGTPVSGSDPAGAVLGSKRLKRGGAYNSTADLCRSAFRVSDGTPSGASSSTGFRLVLILP